MSSVTFLVFSVTRLGKRTTKVLTAFIGILSTLQSAMRNNFTSTFKNYDTSYYLGPVHTANFRPPNLIPSIELDTAEIGRMNWALAKTVFWTIYQTYWIAVDVVNIFLFFTAVFENSTILLTIWKHLLCIRW